MSAELQAIFSLDGIQFIKQLLEFEQRRFSSAAFNGSSTFEEICTDFGPFPCGRSYPVYFVGNLNDPANKHVFIGINPGYDPDNNARENEYLDRNGLYEGYCNIFRDFFPQDDSSGKRYYSNVYGFCRRYFDLKDDFSWQWFHENVIHLDLIPFHSASVQGLRINDLSHFRGRYFQVLVKILRYLSPANPVFLNGFPTIASLLDESAHVRPEQSKPMIEFAKQKAVAYGKLAGEFDFVGLPFLTRVKGGKDDLVERLRARYEDEP